jgi:hypothetical protein
MLWDTPILDLLEEFCCPAACDGNIVRGEVLYRMMFLRCCRLTGSRDCMGIGAAFR